MDRMKDADTESKQTVSGYPFILIGVFIVLYIAFSLFIGVQLFGLADANNAQNHNIEFETDVSDSKYSVVPEDSVKNQFESFDSVYVTSTVEGVEFLSSINAGEIPETGPQNVQQYIYTGQAGGDDIRVTANFSSALESGQIQVIGVQNGEKRVMRLYEFDIDT